MPKNRSFRRNKSRSGARRKNIGKSSRLGTGERYIGLWDEEFVGWPYDSPVPVGKDLMRSDVFGKFQGLKNFQLEPTAVQTFRDVAIAYYMVTATYAPKSGSNEVVAFRARTFGTRPMKSGSSLAVCPRLANR